MAKDTIQRYNKPSGTACSLVAAPNQTLHYFILAGAPEKVAGGIVTKVVNLGLNSGITPSGNDILVYIDSATGKPFVAINNEQMLNNAMTYSTIVFVQWSY